MYDDVKISDLALLQQHLTMESVGDVWYKQLDLIELLVAEKEVVGEIHKHLCNVYGSCVFDRSTAGHWVKRVVGSETGKVELCVLLHSSFHITVVHL